MCFTMRNFNLTVVLFNMKFSILKDSSQHANDENENGKGYRVLRILLNFFLKFGSEN